MRGLVSGQDGETDRTIFYNFLRFKLGSYYQKKVLKHAFVSILFFFTFFDARHGS